MTRKAAKMEEVTQGVQMAEAAGAAFSGGKAAGASAGAAKAMFAASAGGGFFIAALSIAMAPPKSKREMFVAVLSFMAFAVCGSYEFINLFHVTLPEGFPGHVIMFGLASLCGAPGFLLIRAWFGFVEVEKGKPLGEIVRDLLGIVKR